LLAIALLGSRRALDFLWVALVVGGPAGAAVARTNASTDPVGVLYALGARRLATAIARPPRRHSLRRRCGRWARDRRTGGGAGGRAARGRRLFSLSALPFALGVAVLSSALPYSLEMHALTRLPARTVGILVSVEPAMGALLGIMFLDEHLNAFQWLAIAAIIAASIGAVLSAPKARVEIEEMA
jgi:inner membrane transporter RhtA